MVPAPHAPVRLIITTIHIGPPKEKDYGLKLFFRGLYGCNPPLDLNDFKSAQNNNYNNLPNISMLLENIK